MAEERGRFAVAVAVTLLIHATFAAALETAEMIVSGRAPPPVRVAFELATTPPLPPPPVVAEPPPEPAPAQKAPPVVKPVKRVASVAKEPVSPPAPGPPDEAPAPQKIYTLPGPGMAVNPGSAAGSVTGTPGGTGSGKGGGAPLGADGTGGPRPVPLASVASMPQPIGDTDYAKDYPEEAKKLGVEGQVLVRLLVDEEGRVAENKLVRGLGHGLDQNALEKTRKFRFKPARDEGNRAVATWITWTVTFTLPR